MALFGLNGATLVKLDGSHLKQLAADDALASKKIVAYYFSGHWCPPCRAFTPMLNTAYVELLANSSEIEVVFVSCDNTEDDMKNYMKESHGPWLAVPHNSQLASGLQTKFDIHGIPALIVCKSDGSIVTKNGRADVEKEGAEGMKKWLEKA